MKNVIISLVICLLAFRTDAQIITTIAGIDSAGYFHDNGPAIHATLYQPIGIAIDSADNIYISDENNVRIRKINTSGIISTIAGTGVIGYRGDDSIATIAEFCDMAYLKCGYDGNLYIPDVCNNRIRKINLVTDTITTYAGNGVQGFETDDSLATKAQLWYPAGITFDNTGNLVFSEIGGRVYKINDANIMIRVAGGDSLAGYGGDGGPATNAQFNHPVDIAYDKVGNLYISDLDNYVVRKVDTFGIITVFAGTVGVFGYHGANGSATSAELGFPEGIIVDGLDNVFFSDEANNVVWRIDHDTHIISIVAGNGTGGFSGDSSLATNAQLGQPTGLAFDSEGNLYIADLGNNRIRKVTNVGVPLSVRGTIFPGPKELHLFPNPAQGFVTIEAGLSGTVQVYDVMGRNVLYVSVRASGTQIPLENLRQGIFVVEFTDYVGNRKYGRFVKE